MAASEGGPGPPPGCSASARSLWLLGRIRAALHSPALCSFSLASFHARFRAYIPCFLPASILSISLFPASSSSSLSLSLAACYPSLSTGVPLAPAISAPLLLLFYCHCPPPPPNADAQDKTNDPRPAHARMAVAMPPSRPVRHPTDTTPHDVAKKAGGGAHARARTRSCLFAPFLTSLLALPLSSCLPRSGSLLSCSSHCHCHPCISISAPSIDTASLHMSVSGSVLWPPLPMPMHLSGPVRARQASRQLEATEPADRRPQAAEPANCKPHLPTPIPIFILIFLHPHHHIKLEF